MNKWLFHQNGLTITSFLATVIFTRVSNFVEENVCVCLLHSQGSGPGGLSHSLPNTIIVMHSACSKH